MLSSSNAHISDSFPPDIPTSPPAIPSDAESGSESDVDIPAQPFGQMEFMSDDDDSDDDFCLDDVAEDSDEDDLQEKNLDRRFPTSRFTMWASLLSKCLDFNDILTRLVHVPQHMDEVKPHSELLEEVRTLHLQVQQLCDALQIQEASIQAANVHCMIIKCTLAGIHEQLANTVKKKECGLKKVKARVLTLPQLKDAFDAEEEERWQREAEETAREAQKAAGLQKQEQYINEQAVSRIFNHPLSFYFKSHVELQIVACSLGVPDDGTKDSILQLVTDHLEKHPDLRTHERFKGLFLPKGTHT